MFTIEAPVGLHPAGNAGVGQWLELGMAGPIPGLAFPLPKHPVRAAQPRVRWVVNTKAVVLAQPEHVAADVVAQVEARQGGVDAVLEFGAGEVAVAETGRQVVGLRGVGRHIAVQKSQPTRRLATHRDG